jgi:hypothetical protein
MKSIEYKSTCKACAHKHPNYICNWQVQKTGRIELRPVYSDSLWGISAALHQHGVDADGHDFISSPRINTYRDETFEYRQETDCGCMFYVPSDNLEFLEWKYDESKSDL